MIKKIILTLFVSMFIVSYCYADLIIALKQKGDDIFTRVQDNKEEYSCEGKEVVQKDGNINIEISCCNCKGECITITIPTKKTGM